jgi:hypothetical protein
MACFLFLGLSAKETLKIKGGSSSSGLAWSRAHMALKTQLPLSFAHDTYPCAYLIDISSLFSRHTTTNPACFLLAHNLQKNNSPGGSRYLRPSTGAAGWSTSARILSSSTSQAACPHTQTLITGRTARRHAWEGKWAAASTLCIAWTCPHTGCLSLESAPRFCLILEGFYACDACIRSTSRWLLLRRPWASWWAALCMYLCVKI